MRYTARSVISIAAMSFAALAAGLASAQNYPAKPITFIASFPAGSAAEVLGRIVGQKLTERWGQQVVVESKPGAGGTIGAAFVARAAPDGYTMLVGSSGETTVAGSMYQKLAYDTLRDLAPVIAIGPMPNLLVVHPDVPATTVAEFVALARSRPRQINYASSGNGSTSQLGMEMLKLQAGIDVMHVPYKGSQPAIADTIAGRTSVLLGPMATLLPHANAGKLRSLAVSTTKRSVAAPDVPTLAESGYPSFEASLWWGLLAPAATPREIVTQMNAEVNRILQMPDVRAQLVRSGVEPQGGTPEAYAALLKAEIAKWAAVVRESGARID